jgi:hypothetical protein
MRREISIVIAVALACSLVLVSGLYAQIKKDAKTGLDRLEGTVQLIDKEKSIITIRQSGTPNAVWDVVYDAQTKFTFRNEASSFDEVKEGRRVICLGKADTKGRLVAGRVDIRNK